MIECNSNKCKNKATKAISNFKKELYFCDEHLKELRKDNYYSEEEIIIIGDKK